MDQNMAIVFAIATTFISVATLFLTIRRDGKDEKKRREETRDKLNRMDQSLTELVNSNRETCKIVRNHEGRLIRLETRIFPPSEWDAYERSDSRKEV